MPRKLSISGLALCYIRRIRHQLRKTVNLPAARIEMSSVRRPSPSGIGGKYPALAVCIITLAGFWAASFRVG